MSFFSKVRSLFRSDKLDVSRRFDLMREAVTGTMSSFYMARDRQTGKVVGLKILDKDKTAAFELRIKGLKKPLEGEIATLLKHPRIVETLEYGTTTNDEQYLVMEYLDGPSLSAVIQTKSEELVGKRLELVRHMAQGLDAVHKAGYIHRDICPRNYICAKDLQSLKLIDFGLTVPATAAFMQPGNRTGTPAYMAPEIVRRRPTDQKVDIFAFGVSAFQLLTYDLPWPASDNPAMAALHHDSKPPMEIYFYRPKLNRTLGDAVMKCLSRSPIDRPHTMEHFLRLIRLVKTEEE